MEDPICTVEQGQLRGKLNEDRQGGKFFSFSGIPFAKPPLGELRFKDPQPPEKWSGVRDATKEGNSCIAPYIMPTAEGPSTSVAGSEDCLVLNIYTKKINNDSYLKPVMVFIHGGAFTLGSASRDLQGPEYLMTEDIVLVIVQYRLGALGFLSFEDVSLEASGNAGLKDQVQALKWIKNNISAFGGNPNNVTIFGVSAGGASVHYLLVSPLAKGLFHKAIIQSGSVMNPWAQGKNDVQELAQALGCNESDQKQILKFLQEVPAEKIVEAQIKFGDYFSASKIRKFGPSIEKPSVTAFLSENPAKLIYEGKWNKVPLIIGYCADEGLFLKHSFLFGLEADLKSFVPYYLYKESTTGLSAINEKICNFYFKKSLPDISDDVGLIPLLTDINFFRGIYVAARNHAKTSEETVYLYKITVRTNLSLFRAFFNEDFDGVPHGEDLGFLFKNSTYKVPDIVPGSIEDITIQRFVKMWTNFAKTGNPIPVQENLLKGKWKPVTKDTINFLDIGNNLKPGVNPEYERMKFWNEISEQVAKYY